MNRGYIKLVLFALSVSVFILSCRKQSSTTTDDGSGTTGVTDDGYTTNTKDTTFSNAVVVKFSGTTATVTNPFEGNGVSVTITNGDVVVTSTVTTTEINYVLSGRCTNGMFKLYSDYKFNLVLNGVSIINDNGPSINIQSSKKVTVNVLNGTNNRLIDGSTYATSTEDQKAAFFSEGQLNFTGSGNLTVTGNYKHGICSDGYISVETGNITVAKATTDAVHSNDYYKMSGGTVTATASGDGIDCEEGYVSISGGTITVNSADDGITASYDGTDATITPYVSITGGTIAVTSTGEKGNGIKSESYTAINSSNAITLTISGKGGKGIKTTGNLTVTNGNISIATTGAAYYNTTDADIAAPAGINCDAVFTFTAGTLTITSSGAGSKGITVDGSTVINGGSINITTSGSTYTYNTSNTSDPKAIKCDGAITINAGAVTIASNDDGIKSDASVTVNGGTINITKSYEAFEAPAITFTNGNTSVVATNDGINCTKGTVSGGTESNDGSLLTISGGTIASSCSNGDAVDGNGNIIMTGGTLIAQGPPSSPELAFDYNGTFTISGGVIIASGPNSGNMIEATSTTSAQNAVLVKINGNVSAGTLFTITDASGNALVTYAPQRSAYYFVYSSSSLATGSTFKIYTGGSYSAATNTSGLYSGGSYTTGTQKGSFTVSGKLTTVSL
ncbi:MAG: carbohydrate-binding domain-containing protein [Lacibacter sp.]